MKLSQAVMKALLPNTLTGFPAFINSHYSEDMKVGEFVDRIISRVMSSAKPKGKRLPIGPTDPLAGEREWKRIEEASKASALSQFPMDEKLPDGRDRYFKKNGGLVDRLNDQ